MGSGNSKLNPGAIISRKKIILKEEPKMQSKGEETESGSRHGRAPTNSGESAENPSLTPADVRKWPVSLRKDFQGSGSPRETKGRSSP